MVVRLGNSRTWWSLNCPEKATERLVVTWWLNLKYLELNFLRIISLNHLVLIDLRASGLNNEPSLSILDTWSRFLADLKLSHLKISWIRLHMENLPSRTFWAISTLIGKLLKFFPLKKIDYKNYRLKILAL